MSRCVSYCSHGGRCVFVPKHEGLHDSTYCTWSDDEALTKAEADAVLMKMPGGPEYLAQEDLSELYDEDYYDS